MLRKAVARAKVGEATDRVSTGGWRADAGGDETRERGLRDDVPPRDVATDIVVPRRPADVAAEGARARGVVGVWVISPASGSGRSYALLKAEESGIEFTGRNEGERPRTSAFGRPLLGGTRANGSTTVTGVAWPAEIDELFPRVGAGADEVAG